jgi:hypothetical protein
MARKTKETKDKVIKVDVEPVKWKPGDERKPQGYWTKLYRTEYDGIASRLIGAGFTEQNLADTFEVPASAIKGWKRSFPSFKRACNEGKRGQLKRLAASGLREATGYDWTDVKIKTTYTIDADGNEVVEKIEKQEIPMHQAGNPTLATFMMTNISHQLKLDDEEAFKSKQKVEVENRNLNFNVTAELIGDQIDRLAGNLINGSAKQIEADVIDEETEDE